MKCYISEFGKINTLPLETSVEVMYSECGGQYFSMSSRVRESSLRRTKQFSADSA